MAAAKKHLVLLAIGLLMRPAVAAAQVPSYADVYNPLQVFNLNLEMDPADWAAVQSDATLDLEKPAFFSADGESKLLVAVRKKSLSADNDKISLKIDVNEYFDSNQWHGVRKLSLENGFDADVVSEGLAWYLHQRGASLPGANYQPGKAAWVNVTLNGALLGSYASVEQVDKRFLRNHDLWTDGATWLYKKSDIGQQTLVEGNPPGSPTVAVLNYAPFAGNSPPPAGYEAQLSSTIDMKAMLTLGAVNAFTSNPDELFNKGKNFWFVDFDAPDAKRLHFPWDLDAVFKSTSATIYGSNSPYTTYILNNPTFRAQYNQIMLDLLNGPLAVDDFLAFVDQLEPVLTPSLQADLNGNIDDVPAHFDHLRQWYVQRHANVLGQVQSDMALSAPGFLPEPAGIAAALLSGSYLLVRRKAAGVG